MKNETLYQTTSKNIFHIPKDVVAKSYAHDENQPNCRTFMRGKECTSTTAIINHHGAVDYISNRGAGGALEPSTRSKKRLLSFW